MDFYSVFQNIHGLLLVNTGKATLWYSYPMLSLFIRQHVLYAICLKNTRIFCMFSQLQSLWLLIKDAFDMMASLGKWLSKRDQYMYKWRLLFQASQPHNQWESPELLMAVIYIYPVITLEVVQFGGVPFLVLFYVFGGRDWTQSLKHIMPALSMLSATPLNFVLNAVVFFGPSSHVPVIMDSYSKFFWSLLH